MNEQQLIKQILQIVKDDRKNGLKLLVLFNQFSSTYHTNTEQEYQRVFSHMNKSEFFFGRLFRFLKIADNETIAILKKAMKNSNRYGITMEKAFILLAKGTSTATFNQRLELIEKNKYSVVECIRRFDCQQLVIGNMLYRYRHYLTEIKALTDKVEVDKLSFVVKKNLKADINKLIDALKELEGRL